MTVDALLEDSKAIERIAAVGCGCSACSCQRKLSSTRSLSSPCSRTLIGSKVRRAAIETMGKLWAAARAPHVFALFAMLEDCDPDVRLAAVKVMVLGKLDRRPSLSSSRHSLRQKDMT